MNCAKCNQPATVSVRVDPFGKSDEWQNLCPTHAPPMLLTGAVVGLVPGPFEDCECQGHHQHGPRGIAGCPACNP